MDYTGVILGIVIGTLAAIVYSLRVLVLMERRIARIDSHIEALVLQVIKKEDEIKTEESVIESMLSGKKATSKPASKKTSSKPKTSRKKK